MLRTFTYRTMVRQEYPVKFGINNNGRVLRFRSRTVSIGSLFGRDTRKRTKAMLLKYPQLNKLLTGRVVTAKAYTTRRRQVITKRKRTTRKGTKTRTKKLKGKSIKTKKAKTKSARTKKVKTTKTKTRSKKKRYVMRTNKKTGRKSRVYI